MRLVVYKLLFILIFFLPYGMMAQESKEELEAKRKKIENEIEYTNRLLEETRKNKQSTLREIKLINSRLNQRSDLVANLKKEVYSLDNEISTTEQSIENLNNDLQKLRSEYSRVVYFAYKYKTSYNKLIYIFSAEDLNQAYQRMRYLDQIGDFIKKQAKEIKEKEKEKQQYLASLKAKKEEKDNLLTKENSQLYALEDEKAQKDVLSRSILNREKKLRAQLRAKQKEERKLNRQIEDIIAKATAPTKTKSGKRTYSLTPEEKILAESFISNKGKLPWPVEKGVISEYYGVHNHPVLKNVKVRNNGINIATQRGSEARSVFDGKVVSVTTITNTNRAVIIKHGSFFTIYSNLEEVFVQPGQNVNTKTDIGLIHTNNDGDTELHFEIWRGKNKQNPAYWIKR